MNKISLEGLEVSEGAYFYKTRPGKKLSKSAISNIFKEVSKVRMTRSVTYNIVREKVKISDGIYDISACIFKKKSKPSFFKDHVDGEFEIKFCYILIFEYKDFIVISRKNVSIPTSLTLFLEDIDYATLSGLYAGNNSSFHKLSLDNLDVSDSAIRNKSVEARALENSYSTFGANNYAIKNMRVSTNGVLYSLTFSTARINKHSKNVSITEAARWMADVCEDINHHTSGNSFIDSFARPVNFEEKIGSLDPKGLLFKLSQLVEAANNQELEHVYYCVDDRKTEIDLAKYLVKYDQVLNVNKVGKEYKAVSCENENLFQLIDIEVKLLKKSIKLSSPVLSRILLSFSDGEKFSLEEYINKHHLFIITFNTPDIAYYAKKLFENTLLLSNLDAFMSVFEPCNQLGQTDSEKGTFTEQSTGFTPNSIFNKVETVIDKNSAYLFLDDLGNEWADHIAVSDGLIEFYHSKSGSEGLSATKFQDVVGQAQKNLGNLAAPDHRLDAKKIGWEKDYKGLMGKVGVQTKIKRLRKAPPKRNLEDGISFFKEQTRNPNLRKVVYLVVNFISKSRLDQNLKSLKNPDAKVERRNELIQILWFISSLVSSCKEQGTEIKIKCLE